jgi:hypothetical protein
MHAFDNHDLTSGRNDLGHPMQYSWQYAPDSFVLAHGFLDRYVHVAH